MTKRRIDIVFDDTAPSHKNNEQGSNATSQKVVIAAVGKCGGIRLSYIFVMAELSTCLRVTTNFLSLWPSELFSPLRLEATYFGIVQKNAKNKNKNKNRLREGKKVSEPCY